MTYKYILQVIFFLSLSSYAQNTPLLKKTYTKVDGLDLNLVTSMVIDNDGFLWLGGTNLDTRTIILANKSLFLQRFNGNSFHNIYLPKLATPIKKVGQIYKRNDGKFYVKTVTEIGHILYLFDPITTKFTRIKTGAQLNDQIQLSHMFNYNSKDYIITQIGKKITLNLIQNNLSLKPIFSYSDFENDFLLSSSTQFIPLKDYCIIGDVSFPLLVLDWNGHVIKKYSSEAFKKSAKEITKFWIEESFKVNSKYYSFIRDQDQLFTFDEKAQDITTSKLKNTALKRKYLGACNDTFGNHVIVSIINDKMRFDHLKTDGFKTIYEETVKNSDFGYELVSNNLKEDLWMWYNNELYYYKFPKEDIKTYLETNSIRSIFELDTNDFIISTDFNGWFKLNTLTEEVSQFNPIINNNTLKPESSRNIIKVNDSIIWSNHKSSLLRTNLKNLKSEKFSHFPVICLEKPNDSLLIYGTQNYNLMSFNINTKTHKSLLKTDSLYIYDIEIKKNSSLVVAGTDKGLLVYNFKTKKHKFYNNKNQLKDTFILMCDYHKDYGYLLGTRSGYIIGFNPKNESFKTLYKDNLNAGIASILFDNDLWWINTFNGVVSFNPNNKTSSRFSINEGLSNNEANRYSALKTKNNTFFVGTLTGLNVFKPKNLKLKKDNAVLVLLNVKKYDNTLKKYTSNLDRSTLDFNQSIVLPSENRALELHFALKNSKTIAENYNYRYRLNNKEWINLKHQNLIQIPNLAAGKYDLEIEALDFSMKRIGNTISLKIESQEFIYKTWWFMILLSVIIISILLWFLRQERIKKHLLENFSQGLIQSQENERSRIAIELHDSISQQLTLIKRKAQNSKQEEISALTNNTLEEVRTISRGLYPPLLKQLGLTESISQLLLDIDQETNLFVSTEVSNIDLYFNEVQALNCYRFVQECITNVIKHAEAKAISLNVIENKNSILIIIQDNGNGFSLSEARAKNSFGLKTIYERVRILNGVLSIKSKISLGTKITAKIPKKNV